MSAGCDDVPEVRSFSLSSSVTVLALFVLKEHILASYSGQCSNSMYGNMEA